MRPFIAVVSTAYARDGISSHRLKRLHHNCIILNVYHTLWPHPYRLMRHLRTVSYGFVGILYSSRLILLYSNHLECRQTVENHLVHIGTRRRTHVMTSSISIFIFAEPGLSAKIAKICNQRKFPAIRYLLCV